MDVLKSIIVWLIGVAFLLVFFPLTLAGWLIALPFDRKGNFVHWLLIYQACIISFLIPVWRVKIEGREKAKKGTTYVIICNHQSILDILILNCLRYRYKWISKVEVTGVPVLGWYLKMAGYITVDRSDSVSKDRMLLKAYQCLKDETSIMIFPEGTRSIDNEIAPFKRGAFQLAISTGKPILPVIIDGAGEVLPKHGIVFRGFHRIDLKVLDPVMPESFGTDNAYELAEKISVIMKNGLDELRNKRRK